MKTSLKLNKDQYLEFEKLSFGVFSPLEEFMDETNFNSCVESMRLSSGHPFPIPIVLDINKEKYQQIKGLDEVKIYYEDKYVGKLLTEFDKLEFLGKSYTAPKKIVEYLTFRYGKDWRKPK